jgi:hypothetical protein
MFVNADVIAGSSKHPNDLVSETHRQELGTEIDDGGQF